MINRKLAILCVHSSPLAPLGGKKTGGMNVYVRELAYELGRRGIQVDIYTRRTAPDAPEIDSSLGENVRVIHIAAGPPQVLDPNDIYPYLQEFAAGVILFTTKQPIQYDLIYSHYWLSGWVAHKLKEVWGTPFVHMFHTLGRMKNRIAPGGPAVLPDTRITVETQIMGWADRIIAATPAERSQLLWLYRARRRKIRVIPPGVDLDTFRPIPQAQAKGELGLPLESKLLLFVGRPEPLKGVDTILQAIDLLRKNCPPLLQNVRFAVIGGDPDDPDDTETSRLQALSTRLKLNEVVAFWGAKDHNLLARYYAAATVVIVPSDYESFGMVALEAMASGTPVIASEVGGLAFLVKDNETGYHVPVREPLTLARRIADLISDPSAYKRMGQSASRLARQYAWSKICDQLLAVFDEVAPVSAP